MDLRVNIGGKDLINPFCVASGTFGYGSEYESLIDLSSIGAIFTKAVTLNPRPGNEMPRIVETPAGLLNSIGLANVGVEKFLQEKMQFLSSTQCAVITNIAGSSEEEYIQVIEKLEVENDIWGYEINISCPNVACGGMSLGTNPDIVEKLTGKLRRITNKPLIVKLSPNVTDITQIAKAAENGGADAVSCINTLVGMAIDVKNKKFSLSTKTGGLSGPAIRPVGVAATYRVKQSVAIPVIGMGGITNANDALQYFLAGASAIQIGTANFIDPSTILQIQNEVIEYCKFERVESIAELNSLLFKDK